MNIIGKILVILNLIFALVVGGFLVIDYGTRTNWKKAYDNLKNEMEVAGYNYKSSGKTMGDLNTQVKNALAEKEELKQKLVDQEKVARVKLENQKTMTDEALDRAKDADLNAQKAIAEKDRLKEEAKGLLATVQNRDGAILALQEENKQLRTQAIAKEGIAKTTQERNQGLLTQIEELQRKIALREAGVGGDNNFAKDPAAPNPPSTYVKGKIDEVDSKDPRLVQISLGTDQGIKLNHTLEVYRLSPEPQWLGRIRIVDAREHKAVGRLVPGITGRALRVGDIVASSISTQGP